VSPWAKMAVAGLLLGALVFGIECGRLAWQCYAHLGWTCGL